jgi:hypothetical protein
MTKPIDTLGIGTGQFNSSWDWKGEYVAGLSKKEEGYERFSQLSATPDSTCLYAGPARFSAIGSSTGLLPIGLADGVSVNQGAQLARLFEIGSNRSFFTRGKDIPSVSFSRMLADQKNIIATLLANARLSSRVVVNDLGTKGSGPDGGASEIMMNLGSELTHTPFGVLMVFKTRGEIGGSPLGRGKILSAIYMEYCMMEGYNFSVSASSPVIMENIAIQFDRVVPVAIG